MIENKFSYSRECIARCPELHACATEFVIRKAIDDSLEIQQVFDEHIEAGTLSKTCSSGPVNTGAGLLSSRAKMNEVALATTVKVDAWNDLVSLRCSAQARLGGGNIRPTDKD